MKQKKKGYIRRFLPYYGRHKGTLAMDLFCCVFTAIAELVLPTVHPDEWEAALKEAKTAGELLASTAQSLSRAAGDSAQAVRQLKELFRQAGDVLGYLRAAGDTSEEAFSLLAALSDDLYQVFRTWSELPTITLRPISDDLQAQGDVYPCWCSRHQRLAASAPHPGETRDLGRCPCRDLSRAERERQALVRDPAWKAAVPHETVIFSDLLQGPQSFDLARDCGDFVVRRSDGVFGYQLAVTVDDALMGVTRVVRGRDLLDSAARQLWLMERLGWAAPVYAHVPLLLAGDGRRLAKRDRDLDFGALRARKRPQEVLGFLAALAGLREKPEPAEAPELATGFSWNRVVREDQSLPLF